MFGMKNQLTIFACICLLGVNSFVLQASDRIEIPSSFNPVGSGARALGFGGSFIAMADDATAASWNPAGLLKLRRGEFAVAYSYVNRIETDKFALAPEASGEHSINELDLNYLAFSLPCYAVVCGKNMVFSLNYQRLYELSRERKWHRHIKDAVADFERSVDYQQQGALYALGAAFAVQLTPDLFFGLTLNSWQDVIKNNHWSQGYASEWSGWQNGIEVYGKESLQLDYHFEGVNYNLGLLWEIDDINEQKWTLGLVYKSKFTADIKKQSQSVVEIQYPEFPLADYYRDTGMIAERQTITMPSSLGIGVAFQWNNHLTTSLDVYRTWWHDFAFTNSNGDKLSPIDGSAINNQSIADTTQIRVGAEYRILSQQYGQNYIIPIRAGLFLDPLATSKGSENSYGVAIGSGISFKHWVFDIAYQYRFGNNLGRSTMPHLGFSQDIKEHSVVGSVFYRF